MKLSGVNFIKNPPTCYFHGLAGKPNAWKGFVFSHWAEWTEMTCFLCATYPHPTHLRILWHFMVCGLFFPSVNDVMKDSASSSLVHMFPSCSQQVQFLFTSQENTYGTNLHSFHLLSSLAACRCPLAQRWLVGVWLQTGYFCTHNTTNLIRVGAMFWNGFFFLLHAHLVAFRLWPSGWPLHKFSAFHQHNNIQEKKHYESISDKPIWSPWKMLLADNNVRFQKV